jgi:PII-like signaling protein
MKEEFPARMLRIHCTEADRWQGKPLHEAVIAKCQELGLSGAIVFRGTEGFGASARIHHAKTFSVSKNAPIMISIVDTETQIVNLLPSLEQMLQSGLLYSSTVEVVRYSHDQARSG